MERRDVDATRLVTVDADVLGGTPVFAGTRVPVDALWEYLESGKTIDEFLDQFPSVNRSQALDVLELARARVGGDASAA